MANSSRDKNKLLCEALEPRLLFSAGLESLVLGDSLFETDAAIVETVIAPETDLIQLDQSTNSASLAREVVFIDENIDNYEQLIQDLANRDNTDIFILDNSENGIEQISTVLANYQGLDAVHLVSHGNSDGLLIGNGSLDTWNLPVYSDAIQGWQTALSDTADLMIYGCNLAGSSAGVELLNQLQDMTGADIAASDDTTGLAALGGNWDLEYQAGDIEATLAFSIKVQSNWQGTLMMGINPVIDNLDGDALTGGSTYTEGDGAIILDQGTAATETSDEGFNGGNLTVSFTAGNVAAEDILAINDQGPGGGNISLSGSNVNYDFGVGPTTIGTYAGGSAGSDLVISFNASATSASISALLQNISYENTDTATPDITQRTISFVLQDSEGDTSTPNNVTVDITAVNDAPTAAMNTVSTNEDTTYTFSAADFNFSDIDGDTLASIEITTLQSAGTLQMFGVDVTLNQVISKADIDAGNLTFTPAANANGAGYDSFAFSVNDGTVDSAASYTMTLDVTAVNDAPTAAVNTVSTNEDTAYIFSTADFNFSDIDGDTLTSIKITTLQSAGALQMFGVDVTLNQVISKADIDAGNLTFTPAANAIGAGYDSFAFSVNDGTVDSAASYAMTLDVTAINDAPTAAVNTVSTNEDTAYTFSAADFNFSDIDGDTLTSIKITTLQSAGTLQLSGVDVTLNQVISKADIDAGKLSFTPAANATGAGYDSFAFSVNDGTVDSAASYAMTLNVNAVSNTPSSSSDTTSSSGTIDSTMLSPFSTDTNDPDVELNEDILLADSPDVDSLLDRASADTAVKDADIVLTAEANGTPRILLQHNIDNLLPQLQNNSSLQHVVVDYNIATPQAGSVQNSPLAEKALLPDSITGIANLDLNKLLAELNRDLGDGAHAEKAGDSIIVSTTAISIVLTSSFIAWSIKSSSIAAAISSTMPSWNSLDPLSIINKSVT